VKYLTLTDQLILKKMIVC